MKRNESSKMKELILRNKYLLLMLNKGELVEGKVIHKGKSFLVLDLGQLGTGIIYKYELRQSRDMLKEINIGDTISAVIVEPENEDGYIELSLRQASIKQSWKELLEKKEKNEEITGKVIQANKGGLIVKLNDLLGFLPLSQMSMRTHKEVNDLRQLLNKQIKVKVIEINEKQNRVILSERT